MPGLSRVLHWPLSLLCSFTTGFTGPMRRRKTMLKRILKRVRIERKIFELMKIRPISLYAIVSFEWIKFRMRCKAVNRACREVCHG
jgi:hypothetical protein